jgi:hypothetical protein
MPRWGIGRTAISVIVMPDWRLADRAGGEHDGPGLMPCTELAFPLWGGSRPGAAGGDSHMPGQYPARVSDHGFWAAQSLVTEPGPAAAAIDRLPSDLGALRAASQQLVFHYWADGDYAANGIEPERISEIDTRYAAAMFARLGELADLPLSAAREPRQPADRRFGKAGRSASRWHRTLRRGCRPVWTLHALSRPPAARADQGAGQGFAGAAAALEQEGGSGGVRPAVTGQEVHR